MKSPVSTSISRRSRMYRHLRRNSVHVLARHKEATRKLRIASAPAGTLRTRHRSSKGTRIHVSLHRWRTWEWPMANLATGVLRPRAVRIFVANVENKFPPLREFHRF